MNLYLLTQDLINGYDTYDSCVVAAVDEQEARKTHPCPTVTPKIKKEWLEWPGTPDFEWQGWCHWTGVEVKLIGKAAKNVEAGVICASFNAG